MDVSGEEAWLKGLIPRRDQFNLHYTRKKKKKTRFHPGQFSKQANKVLERSVTGPRKAAAGLKSSISPM